MITRIQKRLANSGQGILHRRECSAIANVMVCMQGVRMPYDVKHGLQHLLQSVGWSASAHLHGLGSELPLQA